MNLLAGKPEGDEAAPLMAGGTQVAVGVILDDRGRVCVARRRQGSHLAGKWEFPGGKLAAGETPLAALRRELREELGIEVTRAFPLRRIRYRYPQQVVVLHFFVVVAWDGAVGRSPDTIPASGDGTRLIGREGQPLRWQFRQELRPAEFPAANRPVIDILQLPEQLAITPECGDPAELLRLLDAYREQGVQLVQLRQPQLSPAEYAVWHDLATAPSRRPGQTRAECDRRIRIIANSDPATLGKLGAADCHLNARTLLATRARPPHCTGLLTASCHSGAELARAEAIGVDIALLSPVNQAKYAGQEPLTWDGFRDLAGAYFVPVYALGGVTPAELAVARHHGAMGVAGIRAFLPQARV